MIESAHCTCMAGLGEVCSHVAAILFFLESESRAPRSCTQELCKWNESCVIESIPYAKVCDLPFTLSKPQINCSRKKGAHLYHDTVAIADLPQCPTVSCKFC